MVGAAKQDHCKACDLMVCKIKVMESTFQKFFIFYFLILQNFQTSLICCLLELR